MKKMVYLNLIFFLFTLMGCIEEVENKEPIDQLGNSRNPFLKLPKYEPFIFEYSYYTGFGEERFFRLTNDSLLVFDPNNFQIPVFHTDKIPSELVKKIERLNIYDLETDYSSPSINDGLQITIYFTKQASTKEITLRNYYHEELSPIIEVINRLVPEKHRIWYDREWLLKYTPK